jgi:hypothetical protein
MTTGAVQPSSSTVGRGGHGDQLHVIGEIAGVHPVLHHGYLRLTMRAPVGQEEDDLGGPVGFDRHRVAVPIGSFDRGCGEPDRNVLLPCRVDRQRVAFHRRIAIAERLVDRGLAGYGDGQPYDEAEGEDPSDDPPQGGVALGLRGTGLGLLGGGHSEAFV